MRPRLLPIPLLFAALALSRAARADDAAPPPPRAPAVAPLSPIVAAAEEAEHPSKAASPGLVIAGGILGGMGAAGALAGLVLLDVGSTDAQRDAGRVALSIGAPVAAAGLIMLLVGVQPAADTARFVPTVAVGPTGGALRIRF